MADEPEAQVADGQTAGEASAPSSAETTPKTTSPSEGTAETEGAQAPEGQAETEGGEGVITSERGQKRVQQLANERNQAVAKARSLKERVGTGQSNQQAQQSQRREPAGLPPWQQTDPYSKLGEQGEVTVDQLRQLVTTEADRMAQMRIAQREQAQQRVQNFDQDLNYLEENFPELKGDIEDEKLVSAIDKAKRNFQAALQADPNVRIKDFIEPIMEARSGGVETGRDTASAKLARQQSQGAVTPGTEKTRRVSSEEELSQMLKNGEITAKEAEKRYPDLLLSED